MFLASVETNGVYLSVALSVIALIVTWGLLGAISVFGSGRAASDRTHVEEQLDQIDVGLESGEAVAARRG